MSTHSPLDPKSFQNLLAGAQESGISAPSLSAIVDLHRLFATGELDADGTMRLLAEGALRVANATGVAIGLLQGDHLVYRAGSGSAATSVGRRVMATLTASAHNQASGELLRVENAQTDARIEAAICRQFGANSLLILPIYKDRTLAGVLQVLFSEAHVFHTREVRTYQLMASLVGETMSLAAQLEHTEAVAAKLSTKRQDPEQIPPQTRNSLNDGGSMPRAANNPAVCQACGAPMTQTVDFSALRQLARAVSRITQRANHTLLHERRWKTGMAAAVAALLVMASWIAYSDRRSTAALGVAALEKSNAIGEQVSSADGKPKTPPVPLLDTRKVAGTRPHFVRVGNYELDYVAPDVTVRYFKPKPQLKQVRGGDPHFVYIGEDVTVRYFTPRPAVVQP